MERFAAARAAGFDAVEVLFPYDVAVPDILKALARNDLPLALINCPPPNYTGGARALCCGARCAAFSYYGWGRERAGCQGYFY